MLYTLVFILNNILHLYVINVSATCGSATYESAFYVNKISSILT